MGVKMRIQKRKPEEGEVDFGRATRRALFGRKKVEPLPHEFGKSAVEIPERHLRVKVTMNIDGDVLSFFKQQARETGRSYQILMNDALRDFIEGSKAERVAVTVGNILLSDNSFLAALKEQLAPQIAEDG
jgi:uncharacterized protein (DUF4415 family)